MHFSSCNRAVMHVFKTLPTKLLNGSTAAGGMPGLFTPKSGTLPSASSEQGLVKMIGAAGHDPVSGSYVY